MRLNLNGVAFTTWIRDVRLLDDNRLPLHVYSNQYIPVITQKQRRMNWPTDERFLPERNAPGEQNHQREECV